MYFLKACGDYGKDGRNGDISLAFQNAFAALKIDPNGAYIQNKLALLHLQNVTMTALCIMPIKQ
jgi:hypothetical protein